MIWIFTTQPPKTRLADSIPHTHSAHVAAFTHPHLGRKNATRGANFTLHLSPTSKIVGFALGVARLPNHVSKLLLCS